MAILLIISITSWTTGCAPLVRPRRFRARGDKSGTGNAIGRANLKCPSVTESRLQIRLRFRAALRDDPRVVPLDLLAGSQSDVAEEKRFGEHRGITEVREGFTLAA